ncbi:dinuclear metal center YbgI/SA1388 family protein [Haloferula luteola]|uniref:GTP cyclohydrolase 1 type 2 homolog n=1 Tax=Haloferula luteola TaxID=595692 RepID=A0A840UZW2_9BACT|nr:Nif3-like dinuclear metal center hexameric protein [Haloferula luteola]MBB5350366.1 dinuclear metal center YbgI/SA1388 family protein [Haloferula luteola]
MPDLADVCEWMDRELRIREIPDYSGAVNGLQLENDRPVLRVAAAVDASLPVMEEAVRQDVDLLVVHHGLFWQGARPLVGGNYRKWKTAIEGGLAVYSAHLPLDVHGEWGNNILLAQAIGLQVTGSFLEWKGLPIGLLGEMESHREDLRKRLETAVAGPVHVCPGGPEDLGLVGLCTGGAGSQIAEAAERGVRTLITGEGPHWSFPLAEELGVNVFYAGHYATETFGVRRLVAELGRKFSLETQFLDHPSGL